MGSPVPSAGPHLGRVAEFDRDRGLGVVVDADAGASFGFHATAIADGSRNISVDAQVAFTVSPGHAGRYEASSLLWLD